jgi:hypothetical protein
VWCERFKKKTLNNKPRTIFFTDKYKDIGRTSGKDDGEAMMAGTC